MPESPDDLRVSATLDRLGNWVGNHPQRWVKLGNFESRLLPDIQDIPIRAPLYISGLARSGSTLLLEILASLPGVATHRYQDFPFVFTPYWWNLLLKARPRRQQPKKERAHGDGMLVNAQSPEAMEEMLWMAFFPQLHRSDIPQVLDASASNPAFENFYRDHIKKLLFSRGATRYLAKGNYNLTRTDYLHRLFSDARFVIPIRDPQTHIPSLMRMHERFCKAGTSDPRTTRHMSLTGHFEFGANRIPIHTGDSARMQEIEAAWANGQDTLGWALYWDMLYRFVYTQQHSNTALAASSLIMRFEDLCAAPQATLRALLTHCNTQEPTGFIDRWSAVIRQPITPSLPAADIALIRRITGETAARFGYAS